MTRIFNPAFFFNPNDEKLKLNCVLRSLPDWTLIHQASSHCVLNSKQYRNHLSLILVSGHDRIPSLSVGEATKRVFNVPLSTLIIDTQVSLNFITIELLGWPMDGILLLYFFSFMDSCKCIRNEWWFISGEKISLSILFLLIAVCIQKFTLLTTVTL